ncbi:unnamed protein product [[Candida] boidinii]|uniref:Unnamed protein product n=1 Tax=Candida boidinii TaxID=5477 RepID=A0ACB5TE61_CANBO|nr:unnamed protein product [[Candida] boidinii]
MREAGGESGGGVAHSLCFAEVVGDELSSTRIYLFAVVYGGYGALQIFADCLLSVPEMGAATERARLHWAPVGL